MHAALRQIVVLNKTNDLIHGIQEIGFIAVECFNVHQNVLIPGIGMQTMNYKERLVNTMPHKGEYIHVEVPTHVVSLIEFASGAVVTFMNTLDVWNSKQPWIEIYGTEGTLILPDSNHFTGDVLITRLGYGPNAWQKVPDLVEYKDTQRGAGLADMIEAIQNNRPIRPSAEMACHVNEIINGCDISAETGAAYVLQTTC